MNILSQKISRILEVRTDTPAMQAALEALDVLPSNPQSGGIDAKSIRSVIDRDALNQAMRFQAELERLLVSVRETKSSIATTCEVVHHVRAAICSNLSDGETGPEASGGDGTAPPQVNTFDEEHALARQLGAAFASRDVYKRRYETLENFLEKFEMSSDENYLLEHYNFGQPGSQEMQQGHLGQQERPQFDAGSPEAFQFLDTLEKVRRVEREISVTLVEDDDPAQSQLGMMSALRMMESLAQKKDQAYERLYYFLLFYLHLNTANVAQVPTSSAQQQHQSVHGRMPTYHQEADEYEEELVEERLAHPFVKRALSSLANVPRLQAHCLDLLADSRRSEVTRRFLLALTSGYNGASPIEMRAHDPATYVGDMLAFVFRSFSVECDLAQGLFASAATSAPAEEETEGNDVSRESSTAVFKSPQDIVFHAMSGIARPLRSRILQVISSLARRPENTAAASGDTDEDDLGEALASDPGSASNAAIGRISALYSINGLLMFYNYQMSRTMDRIVRSFSSPADKDDVDDDPEAEAEAEAAKTQLEDAGTPQFVSNPNPLRDTTAACLKEAKESYVATLKVFGATLKDYVAMAEGSDASEVQLAESVLSTISEARRHSPGFERHVLELSMSEDDDALSLDVVCNVMIGATIEHCSDDVGALYRLRDCIAKAQSAGLSDDCATRWLTQVQEKEEDQLEELVGKATGQMLHDCGLGAIAQALWRRELDDNAAASSMASYPGLSLSEVRDAMTTFYSSLYSPPLPKLERVKDQTLKTRCRSKTAQKVCETYQQIYEGLELAKGEYGDLSFLTHTPSQVNTLLAM